VCVTDAYTVPGAPALSVSMACMLQGLHSEGPVIITGPSSAAELHTVPAGWVWECVCVLSYSFISVLA
jgi:hypothetical protein